MVAWRIDFRLVREQNPHVMSTANHPWPLASCVHHSLLQNKLPQTKRHAVTLHTSSPSQLNASSSCKSSDQLRKHCLDISCPSELATAEALPNRLILASFATCPLTTCCSVRLQGHSQPKSGVTWGSREMTQ